MNMRALALVLLVVAPIVATNQTAPAAKRDVVVTKQSTGAKRVVAELIKAGVTVLRHSRH